MDQKYYSLIEMGFTGVVVIGLALQQLWSINREIARDKAAKVASPEDAGHPVGEHRQHDG